MNKFTKFFITAFFVLNLNIVYSQDTTNIQLQKNFDISAFVETYYSINTDKTAKLKFIPSVSPYRDEMRINIAQLSVGYNDEEIRGKLTLHYGDIPEINWAPSTIYKNIQEAYVGFSPAKKFWIDAGFYQTHIGAEGFPPNNFLSSNALISVAEPNFQSGIRFSYEFSEKLSASLHIINGLNLFEDNNKNKTFGLKIDYTPIENLTFSYNNSVGNEIPSSENNPRIRYFHNFVITYSPSKKIDLLGNFDVVHQEKSKINDSSATAYTYGAVVSARYKFNKMYSSTIRCEYYQDLDGLLTGIVFADRGAKGNGFTLGFEYKPIEQAYLRFEYYFLRMDAEQKVFYDNSNVKNEATISFGLGF